MLSEHCSSRFGAVSKVGIDLGLGNSELADLRNLADAAFARRMMRTTITSNQANPFLGDRGGRGEGCVLHEPHMTLEKGHSIRTYVYSPDSRLEPHVFRLFCKLFKAIFCEFSVPRKDK